MLAEKVDQVIRQGLKSCPEAHDMLIWLDRLRKTYKKAEVFKTGKYAEDGPAILPPLAYERQQRRNFLSNVESFFAGRKSVAEEEFAAFACGYLDTVFEMTEDAGFPIPGPDEEELKEKLVRLRNYFGKV